MGAHSRQGRPHRQVQCSKRRAATLECVRDKAGDDLRPAYRRALWRDAVEIQDQHPSKLTLSQSDQMDPDHFKVVPAKPEDIDLVLGILDEAASWIIEQKLPSVWKPGEFSRETFLDQISRGEVHIGLVDGKPVGTITLQWSDPVFWGEQEPESGYVHKLAVRPAYAGQSIGLEMLKWAEAAAGEAGMRVFKLNCLGAGRGIRDDYENARFLYKREIVRPKSGEALDGKAR